MLLSRSLMSCDREGQVDAGVALDGALALEVADAAGKQHHLPDRQLRRRLRTARPRRAAPQPAWRVRRRKGWDAGRRRGRPRRPARRTAATRTFGAWYTPLEERFRRRPETRRRDAGVLYVATARRVELEAAYRATSYFVDGPAGRFAIRVGAVSPEANALAAEQHVNTWAYLTAYNAGSVAAPAECNRARQRELEQAVTEMGFRFLRGEGKGDDGAWPAEPSLLILGIREDEAAALARRFGQAAFVFGERGETARLVWTDGGPGGN